MMSRQPKIDALLPEFATDLSDDDIVAGFARADRDQPWLSVNFVSSIDGAATHNGLSAELGGEADKRVFDLLRRPRDAIVVGAGTVRAEGYGSMRLDAASVAWRVAAGLPAHPVFAIVSRALDLDPASRVFADAPVRPVVVTVETSPRERRAALAEVADVLICGEVDLDARAAVDALAARGLRQAHCEGGPSLFGSLLAADVVDELSLTVSPQLEGGDAGRIVRGTLPSERAMRLASVLTADDTLLLRYQR
jgi:riboflavin biosynthesis pyrimidine reductase